MSAIRVQIGEIAIDVPAGSMISDTALASRVAGLLSQRLASDMIPDSSDSAGQVVFEVSGQPLASEDAIAEEVSRRVLEALRSRR